MLQAIRAGIVLMLGIVCSGCPVKDSRKSDGASADSAVMRALRLQPGDIRYQAPCRVAVETPNLPGPLSCVYVQTATHLHFLRFSGSMGEYEAVLSLSIAEVTQMALARSGSDRQIQLHRAGEFLAFHIAGTRRGRLTEEVFGSLASAGVAKTQPRKWIDLSAALPARVIVPVYVSR